MIFKPKSGQILSKVNSPKDLKKLSISELTQLASEIRYLLIKTVAKNGGHLASNLGAVELTIALHYSYNSPTDKLVWDVGHQAYTHKILTGRKEKFDTIRQFQGLSGYLKLDESKHDAFGAGHVGTAVSAALGLAAARDLLHEKFNVLAIIGDGSLTNGLTYEGINNIGHNETDMTIVLNDNKWSISKNIGGIVKYLEKLSSTRINGDEKTDLEQVFHSLGFRYFGPVDGQNMQEMIDTFRLAKETPGPKLIHVITKKGSGYLHSEQSPDEFHSISPFILESGKVTKDTKNLTYTKAFSNALIKIAKKDPKIIAITAAMPTGTGVDKFAKEFPERFFDTGIAEEHAVVFAAGMALKGFKPVVAIYSTFLQRAYDQIIHDVALQKIPVIFAIDRAGIVGSDGPTHHGAFDISYLRSIPNLTVLAPKDEEELQDMLYSTSTTNNGPVAIRYPRGAGLGSVKTTNLTKIPTTTAEVLKKGNDIALIAIGSMVYPCLEAAQVLERIGVKACVYNARSIKPLDQKMLKEAGKIGKIITVEENILDGGFGSAVLEGLNNLGIYNAQLKRIGLRDFTEHGEISELKEKYGLTSDDIYSEVTKMLNMKPNKGVK